MGVAAIVLLFDLICKRKPVLLLLNPKRCYCFCTNAGLIFIVCCCLMLRPRVDIGIGFLLLRQEEELGIGFLFNNSYFVFVGELGFDEGKDQCCEESLREY